MKRRVVRASKVEGRSDQGEVAAIPQPTVAVAAPAPLPTTAAVVLHPPPLLHRHLHAVPLHPPLHEGKGGVVALCLTRLAGAAAVVAVAAVTAPIGIGVRRAGTGGGVVLRDQAATRKTAVIPGSAGAAGVGPDPERETGAGLGPETVVVAAETEGRRKTGIRRGKGAGSAGTAVTVVAANTSRKPQAKTERGGEKGVIAMKKTRERKIKTKIRTGRKSLIKRKKNQRPRREKRRRIKEAL